MSFIHKLFNTIICFQIILLIIFVIVNIDSLESVNVIFTISEIEYSIQLNFYAITGVIIGIYLIGILSSIQIMGSGFSEQGVRSIREIVGYLCLFALLGITTNVFILPLGITGIFLDLVIVITYLLHVVIGSTAESNIGVET